MTYPQIANWHLVPPPMHGGFRRYLDHGIEPGGFLMSVLSNDLSGAVAHADAANRYRLFDIVKFLNGDVPDACWGSPEKVRAWMKKGGLEVSKTDAALKERTKEGG